MRTTRPGAIFAARRAESARLVGALTGSTLTWSSPRTLRRTQWSPRSNSGPERRNPSGPGRQAADVQLDVGSLDPTSGPGRYPRTRRTTASAGGHTGRGRPASRARKDAAAGCAVGLDAGWNGRMVGARTDVEHLPAMPSCVSGNELLAAKGLTTRPRAGRRGGSLRSRLDGQVSSDQDLDEVATPVRAGNPRDIVELPVALPEVRA